MDLKALDIVDGGFDKLNHRCNGAKHKTSISVSDTGIGIPENEQERIFERFYRVDKSRSKSLGGTGLGLSIVKHAAKYHNARITLDSKLGVGSKFTVDFRKV